MDEPIPGFFLHTLHHEFPLRSASTPADNNPPPAHEKPVQAVERISQPPTMSTPSFGDISKAANDVRTLVYLDPEAFGQLTGS